VCELSDKTVLSSLDKTVQTCTPTMGPRKN